METRTASSAAIYGTLLKQPTNVLNKKMMKLLSRLRSKKNAMALHVIQISCPQRICHVISLITSAKIAWETWNQYAASPKVIILRRRKKVMCVGAIG
ncbi:hypothetical protein ACB092_11G128500 [Castanea dentata]